MEVTAILPEKPDVRIVLSYDEAIALRIILGQTNSKDVYGRTGFKRYTTGERVQSLISILHTKLEHLAKLEV